jgi:hypothetical protein
VTDLDTGTEVPFMFSLKPRPARAGVLASLGVFLALGGAFAAGSNAGTPKSQAPRVVHIPPLSSQPGTLVTRAGGLRLEFAQFETLRFRNDGAVNGRYACHWIDSYDGATKTWIGNVAPGKTTGTVVPNDLPLLRCHLSESETGAVTEVQIGVGTDTRLSGFAISHGTPH